MHLRKYLSILSLTLLLTGCHVVADQYAYTPQQPQEQFATIDHAFGPDPYWHYNFIKNDDIQIFKGENIVVRRINGAYVLPWKKNTQIQNNLIKLSPGPTNFTFVLSGGEKMGGEVTFELPINVLPGEHYQLTIQNSTAYVLDGKGVPLKEVPYTIRRTF